MVLVGLILAFHFFSCTATNVLVMDNEVSNQIFLYTAETDDSKAQFDSVQYLKQQNTHFIKGKSDFMGKIRLSLSNYSNLLD